MRMSRLAMLTATAAAACLLIAGAGGAIAPARASSRSPQFLPYDIPFGLLSVTAISASDAWAVGSDNTIGDDQDTLIVHWNGKKWAPVTTPKPVYGMLWSVSAASANNVWAVGWTSKPNGTDLKSLIMHWNGKAWSEDVGAPVVANGTLNGITATANGVWAVGHTGKAPSITRYTGGHWYVYPTDEPKSVVLDGVAMTGGNAGWSVGNLNTSSVASAFLLRWNGSLWKPVSFPFQKGGDFNLNAVATGPSGAAWAVGEELNPATRVDTPVSMRLSGTTWRKVPVPAPANVYLNHVTFIPGGTAVAVGSGNGATNGMILLRWTGHAWAPMKNSYHTDYHAEVDSVAATSAHNAWAVGAVFTGFGWEDLILHWNGTTWS